MDETSAAASVCFSPEVPTCKDGTIRHAWQQQRQHDYDLFGDRTYVNGEPRMAVRDYSFREYHCEHCGARKQVSTEVRTSYAVALPHE